MDNFTLQSPYFHLVVFMFYFIQNINASHTFKSINNAFSFKMVFPIYSLMLVDLIQYKGTVGLFNHCRFASNSLNYSYFQ